MSQFKDEVLIALRYFANTLNTIDALPLTKEEEEEAAASKINN